MGFEPEIRKSLEDMNVRGKIISTQQLILGDY